MISQFPSPVIGTVTTPPDLQEDARMEDVPCPLGQVTPIPTCSDADMDMAPPPHPPLHPPPLPPSDLPALNLIPPTPQNLQEARHQVAGNLLHPPKADTTQATPPPSTASEPPVEQPTRAQHTWGRSCSPLSSQLATQLRLDTMATTLSLTDKPVT